ncbi:hypothetical protein D3C87_79900 [compost metagenome]
MNKKILKIIPYIIVGLITSSIIIFMKHPASTTVSQNVYENFVSIGKQKDVEIFLDLENGCKYYKNFGPKYKKDAKTLDCEKKYITEYQKNNKIKK